MTGVIYLICVVFAVFYAIGPFSLLVVISVNEIEKERKSERERERKKERERERET